MIRVVRPVLIAAVLAALPLILVGGGAVRADSGGAVLTRSDVDLLIALSHASGEGEFDEIAAAGGLSRERFSMVLMKFAMVDTAFEEIGEGGDWRVVARTIASTMTRFSGGEMAIEFTDDELDLIEGNRAAIEGAFKRLEPLAE